jgi:hypothetical protein
VPNRSQKRAELLHVGSSFQAESRGRREILKVVVVEVETPFEHPIGHLPLALEQIEYTGQNFVKRHVQLLLRSSSLQPKLTPVTKVAVGERAEKPQTGNPIHTRRTRGVRDSHRPHASCD